VKIDMKSFSEEWYRKTLFGIGMIPEMWWSFWRQWVIRQQELFRNSLTGITNGAEVAADNAEMAASALGKAQRRSVGRWFGVYNPWQD